MQIFCDFDGTITKQDTTDIILERFAAPEWEIVEAQWKAGLIGSAQCMQQQIALINVSLLTLDSALDEMEIDPAFPNFLSFCASKDLSLTVISDGVDYFIRRILMRHNISHLPVKANRLIPAGRTSYKLESPYANETCPSGVCKCRAVNSRSDIRVYVGDGRSDFCTADKADLLFAKHALAEYCDKQEIPYISFDDFTDVQRELAIVLSGLHPPILYQPNTQIPA